MHKYHTVFSVACIITRSDGQLVRNTWSLFRHLWAVFALLRGQPFQLRASRFYTPLYWSVGLSVRWLVRRSVRRSVCGCITLYLFWVFVVFGLTTPAQMRKCPQIQPLHVTGIASYPCSSIKGFCKSALFPHLLSSFTIFLLLRLYLYHFYPTSSISLPSFSYFIYIFAIIPLYYVLFLYCHTF